VAVNFDETNEDTWDGSNEFTLKATVTNNGAKTQTYDLTKQFNDLNWDLIDTDSYNSYKRNYPWILELDSKGYPSKVRLEANQTENITFKLKIKKPDVLTYNFTLKASESGAVNTRDVDEYTFGLNNVRIKGPAFSKDSSGRNSAASRSFNMIFSTDNLKLNDTRPLTYELTLKLKKGGRIIDPETLSARVDIEINGNMPAYEKIDYNYSSNGSNDSFIKITVQNAKFTSLDQAVKMIVSLDRLQNGAYEVIGKVQAYDPITRRRLAFSKDISFTLN
jgi:hypothetical protein